MQCSDLYWSTRGVTVLLAVLAVERQGVAGEANSQVVLFYPGHSKDNRIVRQLSYKQLNVFVVVLNAHLGSDVVGQQPTLSFLSVEHF